MDMKTKIAVAVAVIALIGCAFTGFLLSEQKEKSDEYLHIINDKESGGFTEDYLELFERPGMKEAVGMDIGIFYLTEMPEKAVESERILLSFATTDITLSKDIAEYEDQPLVIFDESWTDKHDYKDFVKSCADKGVFMISDNYIFTGASHSDETVDADLYALHVNNNGNDHFYHYVGGYPEVYMMKMMGEFYNNVYQYIDNRA